MVPQFRGECVILPQSLPCSAGWAAGLEEGDYPIALPALVWLIAHATVPAATP